MATIRPQEGTVYTLCVSNRCIVGLSTHAIVRGQFSINERVSSRRLRRVVELDGRHHTGRGTL